MTGKKRARHFVSVSGRAFAIVLSVLTIVLSGVALTIKAGIANAWVVPFVEKAVSAGIAGELDIERMGAIDLRGEIAHLEFRFLDPSGDPALVVYDATAEIDLPVLVSSLFDKGPIRIRLGRIRIASVDLPLGYEEGSFGMARVFEPTTPSKDEPSEPPVAVVVEEVFIGNVWIHGIAPAVDAVDAELHRVTGALAYTADGLELDDLELAWEIRPVTFGLPARGELDAATNLPLEEGAYPSGRLSITGTIASSPFSVNGRVRDRHYTAKVEMPTIGKEILQQWTNAESGSAFVEVTGTFEQATADLRVQLGEAHATAHAALAFESGDAKGELSFRQVNLSTLSEGAPATQLAGRIKFDAQRLFDESRRVRVDAHLDRSTAAGYVVPPIEATARWRDRQIAGSATVHEPGMLTTLTYELTLAEGLTGLSRATAELHSRIPDMNGVERIGPIAAGSADLDAKATYDFQSNRLTADLNGQFTDLSRDGVEIERATVDVEVEGPVDDFRIDGEAHAEGLEYEGESIAKLAVDAEGTRSNLDVSLTASGGTVSRLTARAKLDLTEPIEIEDLYAKAARRGVDFTARAESIRFGKQGVEVEGLKTTGLGDLEVEGRVGDGRVDVKARGKSIRLDRLARLLGIDGALKGVADVDLELRGDLDNLTGHIRLDGADISVNGLEDIALRGDLRLDEGIVSGTVTASAEDDIVRLIAEDVDLRPVSKWTELRTWLGLQGALELHAKIDLEDYSDVLPEGALPAPLEGTVLVSARIAGRGSALTPDVDFSLATSGAVLPEELGFPASLALDVRARGRIDGETRDARLAFELLDDRGRWIEAVGQTEVPEELLRTPENLTPAKWLDTPFDLRLAAEPRRLATLPIPFAKLPIDGMLSGRVLAKGTGRDPDLFVSARLMGLESEQQAFRPIDTIALARYSDGVSRMTVHASSERRPVAAVRATVDGTPRQLMAGEWTAEGAAKLGGLPLAEVALLAGYQIGGTAYGELTVDGVNRNPQAKIALRVDDLRVGEARYTSARVEGTLRPNRIEAQLGLSEADGGFARASFNAAIQEWPEPYLPQLDLSDTELSLKARALDPSLIQPFTGEFLTKVGGNLTADLSVRPGRPDPLEGSILLDDGVIQTPTIGQTLRDVTLRAEANKDRLVVTELKGRGLQGRFKGEAELIFDGLAFRRANAKLRIPDDHPMPLTLEGVSYGKVSGRVEVEANLEPEKNVLRTNVFIPELELELPPKPTRAVQDLEEAPHIHAGYHDTTGKFHPIELQLVEEDEDEVEEDPMTVVVRVELGDDVILERANQLQVKFDGVATFEMAGRGEPVATGQIELVDGWLDVLGKRFVIEGGTVTFQEEELANPVVVASARWESPEGTLVRAEFRGPVETGNLELSSSPPMPESAIMSLLILGTSEGTTAGATGESGGVASGAAQVGGALVTRGLDQALTSLTNLEISTRIDTSENAPRPEVMVRVTRRLAVELTYNPNSSTPVGRQDNALLTFVFTLPNNWVLESTVGDAGTSLLDLIWRYRY